jgi:hypothetical protein
MPWLTYQSENINKKMILWNKIRSIEMTILDTIISYLMNLMHIHDQLATIEESITDVELVNMALNGFTTSWKPFVKGICAHENIPIFEILWDDCI